MRISTNEILTMRILLLTLTCLFLLRSSSLQAGSPSPAATNAPISDVAVWVDGPWAYTDDPRDSTRIVLIAPEPTAANHFVPAIGHKGGALEISPDSTIQITNLSSNPCPTCSNDNPYRAKVDRQRLLDLLKSKKDRYAISLPKPDYYEEGVGQESKVGTIWWGKCYPACTGSSTRKSFTTQVILHYTTKDSQGFSVDGTSYYFEDRNRVEIFMNPRGKMDDCDSGGRLAFRERARLFSLTRYIDYGDANNRYPSDDDPQDCLGSDPQNPSNGKVASLEVALERLEDYVMQPASADASQAREAWIQVNHARNLVSKDNKREFERSMASLAEFLKRAGLREKANIDSALTLGALQSLRAVHQSIPFHDGSGACRNPVLALTY
jgi:hypothetical protein